MYMVGTSRSLPCLAFDLDVTAHQLQARHGRRCGAAGSRTRICRWAPSRALNTWREGQWIICPPTLMTLSPPRPLPTPLATTSTTERERGGLRRGVICDVWLGGWAELISELLLWRVVGRCTPERAIQHACSIVAACLGIRRSIDLGCWCCVAREIDSDMSQEMRGVIMFGGVEEGNQIGGPGDHRYCQRNSAGTSASLACARLFKSERQERPLGVGGSGHLVVFCIGALEPCDVAGPWVL